MKPRKNTRRIIFHHSLTHGGNAVTIRNYHVNVNEWEDIGYHFVITRAGEIQHGRDIKMIGSHALGRNADSVGVCIVGNFFKELPSPEQLIAVQRLYHDVCRAYKENLKVEFHRPEYFPNACPGPKLARPTFLNLLRKAEPW